MLPAVIPQTIPLLASSTNDNKRARLRCVDISISRISSSFSIIARITLECALEFEPLYLDVVSDSVGHTAYRVNSFHLLRPIENRMSLSIYRRTHVFRFSRSDATNYNACAGRALLGPSFNSHDSGE